MSFYSDASAEDMSDELETLGWYHYDLSRHAAEALLLSNGSDGSYLLRNSNEGPGCFALSVRAKDSVKHFHVTRKDRGYVFGFNEFATLHDFVNHFANQPLLGSDTGTLIVLKRPYPWRVEEPSIYESVRVHSAIQTGRTEHDLVPSAPSLGTKEGYLVKQGALVKNWKQRWFTLNRYELKYFKDKTCEEPIRTLDLRACSAVQFDYSQDRVNCFCKGKFEELNKRRKEGEGRRSAPMLKGSGDILEPGVSRENILSLHKDGRGGGRMDQDPEVETITDQKRSMTAVRDTGDGEEARPLVEDILSAG